MKTLLCILFIYTLYPLLGKAQAPTIQWQKSLGGSWDDVATSIQQTKDNGYIVAGYSFSMDGDLSGNHGLIDYWIVKLTSTGSITWQKNLGGTDEEFANSIYQTTDGGYIVAGYSKSNDGDVSGHHGAIGSPDYWIVKLSSTGNIVWQKSLGGSGDDVAYCVQQTKDGGYIVAGWSGSLDGDVTGNHGGEAVADYWIVKLNSSGSIVWQESLGGTETEVAYSIEQTKDGGYIVAGESNSNNGDVSGHHGGSGNPDFDDWIVKLDSLGSIVWQKSLGGTTNDGANSVQQTKDKGYIVAGYTRSVDGNVTGNHGGAVPIDYWVVKLNKNGKLLWEKCLGGTQEDEAFSVQQTTDKGYIVAGFSGSYDGDVSGNHPLSSDYWVVKLNSSGSLLWEKSLGGYQFDQAFSIQQTKDGGYIVAGESSSNDGDVTGNHGADDYWIVKLNPSMLPINYNSYKNDSNIATVNLSTRDAVFEVAPNPVTSEIKIKSDLSLRNALISITDLRGKVLFTATHDLPVSDFITVPAVSLDPGMYILSIQAGSIKKSMKLIKQ